MQTIWFLCRYSHCKVFPKSHVWSIHGFGHYLCVVNAGLPLVLVLYWRETKGNPTWPLSIQFKFNAECHHHWKQIAPPPVSRRQLVPFNHIQLFCRNNICGGDDAWMWNYIYNCRHTPYTDTHISIHSRQEQSSTFLQLYIYIHIYIYICVYIYTYIYIYIYIYEH